MRKVWKGLAVLAACMTLFTACGKEEHGTVFTYPSPETAVSARFSPGKTPSQRAAELAAMPKNPLTGEPGYPESALGKRPVAIMVNNLNAALPHRGLSQADILYEVAVEGGITRILAVFADISSVPSVGPVRSARHYYTDLLVPYNALYVHFGGSNPGKAAIQNRGIDNIDGLIYGATAFTKDNWRAQNRGVEHSYFIDGAAIQSVAEQRGYSLNGETTAPFVISQKKVELPQKAGSVYVKFSGYTNSEFTWNPDTGFYEKKRNGEPHMDENNSQVLQFANVLVLSTSITSYNGGDLREVALNSGTGWFFTGGGVEKISWKKGSYQNQFTFTAKDGTPITGNVGPTFIAIIDHSMASSMKIS